MGRESLPVVNSRQLKLQLPLTASFAKTLLGEVV
jgi:hypothetical protein